MSHELLNRWDAKWAHPEVIDAGVWVTSAMNDPYDEKDDPAEVVEARRDGFRAPIRPMLDEMCAGFTLAEHLVEEGCPEEPDAPAVRVLTVTPDDVADGERLPLVYTICGGGLKGGATAELGILSTRAVVAQLGRVVQLCFDYRVAPADPYPAAINDCHAVWAWAVENAGALHVDTDRIVIYGGSTGGHLGLALPLRLKRYGWCGAPMPRGVVAAVPALLDNPATESARYSFISTESGKVEIWDANCANVNERAWLGDFFGAPDLSPEAMPTRATVDDLAGYPPVWIPFEAEFEPGRDDIYGFVAKLHERGVFCDFHLWGATSHLSYDGGDSDWCLRRTSVVVGALRDAITFDFRRPWL